MCVCGSSLAARLRSHSPSPAKLPPVAQRVRCLCHCCFFAPSAPLFFFEPSKGRRRVALLVSSAQSSWAQEDPGPWLHLLSLFGPPFCMLRCFPGLSECRFYFEHLVPLAFGKNTVKLLLVRRDLTTASCPLPTPFPKVPASFAKLCALPLPPESSPFSPKVHGTVGFLHA